MAKKAAPRDVLFVRAPAGWKKRLNAIRRDIRKSSSDNITVNELVVQALEAVYGKV